MTKDVALIGSALLTRILLQQLLMPPQTTEEVLEEMSQRSEVKVVQRRMPMAMQRMLPLLTRLLLLQTVRTTPAALGTVQEVVPVGGVDNEGAKRDTEGVASQPEDQPQVECVGLVSTKMSTQLAVDQHRQS